MGCRLDESFFSYTEFGQGDDEVASISFSLKKFTNDGTCDLTIMWNMGL
jgi:hypothetical protein